MLFQTIFSCTQNSKTYQNFTSQWTFPALVLVWNDSALRGSFNNSMTEQVFLHSPPTQRDLGKDRGALTILTKSAKVSLDYLYILQDNMCELNTETLSILGKALKTLSSPNLLNSCVTFTFSSFRKKLQIWTQCCLRSDLVAVLLDATFSVTAKWRLASTASCSRSSMALRHKLAQVLGSCGLPMAEMLWSQNFCTSLDHPRETSWCCQQTWEHLISKMLRIRYHCHVWRTTSSFNLQDLVLSHFPYGRRTISDTLAHHKSSKIPGQKKKKNWSKSTFSEFWKLTKACSNLRSVYSRKS